MRGPHGRSWNHQEAAVKLVSRHLMRLLCGWFKVCQEGLPTLSTLLKGVPSLQISPSSFLLIPIVSTTGSREENL